MFCRQTNKRRKHCGMLSRSRFHHEHQSAKSSFYFSLQIAIQSMSLPAMTESVFQATSSAMDKKTVRMALTNMNAVSFGVIIISQEASEAYV